MVGESGQPGGLAIDTHESIKSATGRPSPSRAVIEANAQEWNLLDFDLASIHRENLQLVLGPSTLASGDTHHRLKVRDSRAGVVNVVIAVLYV